LRPTRVTVLHGDANQIVPAHAPFDLLFFDGGWQEPSCLPDVLKPGAPERLTFRRHDPKRTLFFDDERLVSAEIVLPDLKNAVLVGTRRAAR
jgi:protein-L-isoaspartate O-methyltransferase